MKKFWEKFYQRPLDQIPWHKAQADWFEKLIGEGKIKGESAMDVGCGVGQKSIYLAEKGLFKEIIGVDISEKAIEIATQTAEEKKVGSICSFMAHDASDLSFLPPGKQFDFVVDWAAIHCIAEEKRKDYAEGISQRVKSGGLLLMRTFSTDTDDKFFVEKNEGMEEKVSLLKEKDIAELYPDFEIIDKNISQPRKYKNLIFLELLLRKK